MRYVVWLKGKGYFESYKDKLSDKYTDNIHMAKCYLSISTALNRLDISIDMPDIKAFSYANTSSSQHIQLTRDLKISKITKSNDISISFVISCKGRIDKVDDNGNFICDATDEVVKYIENKINSNKSKLDSYYLKNKHIIGNSSYIEEVNDSKNFWDDF